MYGWAARFECDPVWWDYHVIAVVFSRDDCYICDFDTTMAPVTPALEYVGQALEPALEFDDIRKRPRVRVVDAATLYKHFSSDRRHMMSRGTYQSPPPKRTCVRGPEATTDWNLDSFMDVETPLEDRGTTMDMATFRNWLKTAPKCHP